MQDNAKTKPIHIASVKAQSGVTLIELLVVIVLLGIAIALVGPLTLKQVDSARARNEQLLLQRWLQEQSYKAFTTEAPIFIRFDGKAVYRNVSSAHAISNRIQGQGTLGSPSPDFLDWEDYLDTTSNSAQLNSATPKPDIIFSYLFFEPQSIEINKHGYINARTFKYHYKGIETTLNLDNLKPISVNKGYINE